MKTRLLAIALIAIVACSRNPPPERIAVVIAEPPPAAQAEHPGGRPHDGYVWVAGYWNRVGPRFVWVPGFWTVPPRGYRRWEAARWHHSRRGWLLVRGRWR